FWARGSKPRIIRTIEGVVIVTALFLLVVEIIVNGGLNSIANNGLTPELPLFAVFTLGRMTIAYFLALAFALFFGIATSLTSRAYGLRGVRYLRQIVLPAVYPELIWTSILAWGSGWYLIPIEEYVPFGGKPVSAMGLGAYIAKASADSDVASALFGLIILVTIIYAIDQLVWRPLGARAEKYKYESVAAPRTTATPRSVVSEGVKRYEDRI